MRVFTRCLLTLACLAVSLGACAATPAEGCTVAVPPRYDAAMDFSEGLAAVMVLDGETEKWGFIDRTGKEIVPPRYDDWWWYEDGPLAFHDGVAKVALGGGNWETGRCGFIDNAGREVVPCTYGDAHRFSEGLAAVQVYGGTWAWGFIDKTGREVIPPQYDDVGDFHDGLAMVMVGSRGVVDGWDIVDGQQWGYIDKTGKVVVPVIYDMIGEFHEGRACVVKDGKLGFIDETGAVVIPLTYESPYPSLQACYKDILPYFSEGLAAIWGGDAYTGPYGYIDRDGNVAIPFDYDYAAPFSEGLAYVSKGGFFTIDFSGEFPENAKFGFIGRDGEAVVPLVFDCDYLGGSWAIFEQYFSDGVTRASKRDHQSGEMQYGMIDRTGAVTVPIRYDWIWRHGWYWDFTDGLALVGFSDYEFYHTGVWNGCGLVDGKTGVAIAEVGRYDGIESFREGYARVRHSIEDPGPFFERNGSGKHGFIDAAGREVVPCVFDDAGSFSEGLAAVLIDGKWGYIAITE